jgi:glycosyltransferase involved in cell wall biosynthesis
LRILFVIKSLTMAGGGAERVLASLTADLAGRGHSIKVATFDRPDRDPFYAFDPEIEFEPLAIGNVAKRTTFALAHAASALKALIEREQPDVAVGFMHSAYIPLAIAARRTPVVASEHTAFGHFRKRPLQALLIRSVSPLCAAFTIPSEKIGRDFPGSIARKMVAIPNPVEVPPTSHRAGRDGRRIILSVGGLRREKNHHALIAAFARVAEAFPDWDLRLVGDGPLRARLASEVRRHRLGSRVAFVGAVQDVDSEYAAADLFAMPSSYESFGLAAAEALAHGLPVIAFAACPGINELVVDGQNGVLVEPSEAALARGLERLMSSAALRKMLGEGGPRSIERYSTKEVASRWEGLLLRLAAD